MDTREGPASNSNRGAHTMMPSEHPISLSIVTNSHLLGEGITSLLCKHMTLNLIAVYAINAAVDVSLPNPDGHIVILDGTMQHSSLLECIHRWRRLNQPAPIVVIELENNVDLIVKCIEAGVAGYLLRGASTHDLAKVIIRTLDGIAQCSPEVTAQIFKRLVALSASHPHSLPNLTPREMEVLHHIAQGKSNKEIAQALVIEVRTVKHHVHNILRKMNVRHRWDAARLARERGWLNDG